MYGRVSSDLTVQAILYVAPASIAVIFWPDHPSAYFFILYVAVLRFTETNNCSCQSDKDCGFHSVCKLHYSRISQGNHSHIKAAADILVSLQCVTQVIVYFPVMTTLHYCYKVTNVAVDGEFTVMSNNAVFQLGSEFPWWLFILIMGSLLM